MTTPAFDRYDHRRNFEVPVPPDEFGHDGGAFYRCYDELAEEIDNNMVEGLKQQLDGLLIFAGLFAGVNSAFLALTLPLMSADPADDTNALLRENNALLRQSILQSNDSIPSPISLPSETFSPTGKILTVNVLFSLSLTLALLASFLAVLGRQWLVYYRKRTGGGPDRQRWEQLRRFLGAQTWKLEVILDDILPSILQAGLITFCISLATYLNILHPILSSAVKVPMWIGLAILTLTTLLAAVDRFCPFQSSLPHLILRCLGLLFSGIVLYLKLGVDIGLFMLRKAAATSQNSVPRAPERANLWSRIRQGYEIYDRENTKLLYPYREALFSFPTASLRRQDALHAISITRAICASDDPLTLAYSLSNLMSIKHDALRVATLGNLEFHRRLLALREGLHARTLEFFGRDQTGIAISMTWLHRAAALHANIARMNNGESTIWLLPVKLQMFWKGCSETDLTISSFLSQSPHPKLINACLCDLILYSAWKSPRGEADPSLARMSELQTLFDPTWERIGIILLYAVQFCHISLPSEDLELKQSSICRLAYLAYTGEPTATFRCLSIITEEIESADLRDSAIFSEILVNGCYWASKAAINPDGHPTISVNDSVQLFLRYRRDLRTKPSSISSAHVDHSVGDAMVRLLSTEAPKVAIEVPVERGDSRNQVQSSFGSVANALKELLSSLICLDCAPTAETLKTDLSLLESLPPILDKLDAARDRDDPTGNFSPILQAARENYERFKSRVEDLNAEIIQWELLQRSARDIQTYGCVVGRRRNSLQRLDPTNSSAL